MRLIKQLFIGLSLLIATATTAQTNLKFGHVNTQAILQEMPELKSVEDQLQAEYDKLEKQLTDMQEALKTMQEQALDIDVRYVMLVGDIMTFSGGVSSIGRYGVAGSKTSILARAAFEETIKHLVRASIRNEVDNLQGIFENIMIGQVAPSGTGMFDLIAKFEEEKK